MASEKTDAAIKKITEEANEHPNSKKFQIFSELLIDTCTTDEIAEKLLNPEKTIKDADKKIADAARKDDGCITDTEAHAILFEYFGIPVPTDAAAADYSALLL